MGLGPSQNALKLRSFFELARRRAILLLVWRAPYDNLGRIFVMLVTAVFSYCLLSSVAVPIFYDILMNVDQIDVT